MTDVLVRGREGDETQERMLCDDGGRNWNDIVTSQIILTTAGK